MTNLLLKKIRCRWCGHFFYVCQHCWRGQAYCSCSCRLFSQRQSRRLAQQKYRRTEKGKCRHREAEKRRRMRQNEKTMDDASSTPDPGHAKVAWNPNIIGVCCRFCGKPGRIVKKFPRRSYGRRQFEPVTCRRAYHDTKATAY